MVNLSESGCVVTAALLEEIRKNGAALVACNRMFRANIFTNEGDYEEAQRLEREGDLALGLVGANV